MATKVDQAEKTLTTSSDRPDAKKEVVAEAANEFVFAVVGHIGSGTSKVAESFQALLESRKKDPIQTKILKARDVIEAWAKAKGKGVPDTKSLPSIETADAWQNLGDDMRFETKDHAAVAKGLIGAIRTARASFLDVKAEDGEPVAPDGSARAYILDALRHPAEVNLLRHVYQDAFVLIGVVCDGDTRQARLQQKLHNPNIQELLDFMQRDAKAKPLHGQQVAKTFHLSDFLSTTPPIVSLIRKRVKS